MLKMLQVARFIEDTPTSKIRSAHQGYVELEGHAHAIALFREKSPLTLTPCCWYYFRIEELVTRTSGNNKERIWQLIKEDASAHFFLLRDDTGSCVISPLGAQITTLKRKQWESSNLPDHLTKSKKSLFNLLGKRRYYRFTESIIEEGDTIYALGHFESIKAPQNIFKQNAKTSFYQHKNRHKQSSLGYTAPILFKPEHFEQAKTEWLQLQEQHHLKSNFKTLNIMRHIKITKQPYIISNYSQRKLSIRYKWSAFGYALFFVLVGFAPCWLIIQRYFI